MEICCHSFNKYIFQGLLCARHWGCNKIGFPLSETVRKGTERESNKIEDCVVKLGNQRVVGAQMRHNLAQSIVGFLMS